MDTVSTKSVPTNPQLARDNMQRFRAAVDAGHESYVREAQLFNEFYAGEQWTQADKKSLDESGRPALTLNTILPTVNAILGEQLERKIDVQFAPGPGGNPDVAFVLNDVTRSILAMNRFTDVEEVVFSDGVIADRGFFDIRLDFTKNLNGDIIIEAEDGVDIVIDPEARDYDPRTWNEVFVSRWMTPDEVGVEYGDALRDEVIRLAETNMVNDEDNYQYYDRAFGTHVAEHDNEEIPAVRRVRIIERQHYRLDKQLHFVDTHTGDLRPIPFGFDRESADAFANEHGLGVIERKVRRVRVTTSVDDVLLYDDWSLYRTFTIVPFFPYFRRGKPFGVVRNLIDPQTLLNKTSSQELHIVNTTANSGWVIQEDSLVDMDAEDLETDGAKTGLVLQYKRTYEKPEKIQPNQIPTGIERISMKAADTIRQVSAVNNAMMGTGKADQSGRSKGADISRGQVQVSVILNNLLRSRRLVVEKVLEIVQDYYTEHRYFQLVGTQSLFGGDVTGERPPVQINAPQEDGNILNDVTVGKYNVEVTHAPAGGSAHDIEMDEAIRLRELGVQVPDHVMVGYSNLRQRGELSEFLKQAQGFGDPTPEQQQMQQFQMQFEMQRLQKELQQMDADVQQTMANAQAAMAKANTQQGYNQAQMEMAKLQMQHQQKMQELSLRIALAARSHENMQIMNDKRIQSQVLMQAMDLNAQREQALAQPTTPSKSETK